MFDVRTPKKIIKMDVGKDIEDVQWDPNNGKNLYLCTDKGFLIGADARSMHKEHLFNFRALKDTLTSLSMS